MESSRMHLMLSLLASTLLVLLARASCEDSDYLETRALDFYSPIENPYQEKELSKVQWCCASISDDTVRYYGCVNSSVFAPIMGNKKIGALQEVLEKLKSKRLPTFEKKYGQVPMCDAGEQCAVRKGPRIGRLCDCPRRTSCNSFLLKCL